LSILIELPEGDHKQYTHGNIQHQHVEEKERKPEHERMNPVHQRQHRPDGGEYEEAAGCKKNVSQTRFHAIPRVREVFSFTTEQPSRNQKKKAVHVHVNVYVDVDVDVDVNGCCQSTILSDGAQSFLRDVSYD